jgi:ATP-dependent Clp protease ATP-binding subunit ClpC
VELMVNQLNQNLAQRHITVTVTEEARKWILDKTITDRNYGARPLRRALQKYIEDPLSEALIQGSITTRPGFLEVYLENDRLFYRQIGEGAEKHEGVLLYS